MTAVGPVKQDQRRIVGIFYIAWHTDSLANMKQPFAADVTKVLLGDPNARLDAKHPLWTEGSYHWGEPEAGYFLSKDQYVIRKDMSMLADAGVDVLVMDVTNAVRYWDEWDVIFPVMQQMKAEGNKVPQFCFWAFNGPCITVVQDLYEKIYKAEKYKDLWFYWDGKPLLLYNGTPLGRREWPGAAASESALRSGRQDRSEPSALRRPCLHRAVLHRLLAGSEGLLHTQDDVVGILRVGGKPLHRNGRQLEFWLRPRQRASAAPCRPTSWSRATRESRRRRPSRRRSIRRV